MPKADLRARFEEVRAFSAQLCEGLCVEDTVVQTMADTSPTKWHLGHTTWALETFVLGAEDAGYQPFADRYALIFNSYYNTVGEQWDRPRRGVLARPTLDEVWAYRRAVDERVLALLAGEYSAARVEIALQHEQQHQELMLTDLKHVFGSNPLEPVYRAAKPTPARHSVDEGFVEFDEGVVEIGAAEDGFAYDNERPRHRVFLEGFSLARDLVTAGEYRAFIDDDGYRRPELWLDDGWQWVKASKTCAPLYWRETESGWQETRLSGPRALEPEAPVCHISFYEADAFARWRGARLPTEAEWEHAAVTSGARPETGFVDDGHLHPVGRRTDKPGLRDLFGEVWEWTTSAYGPYPRFVPLAGTLAEYNGKFMNAQRVLRGGSCATSRNHVRASYRNFFQAEKRWQFSGIRLAKDAEEK